MFEGPESRNTLRTTLFVGVNKLFLNRLWDKEKSLLRKCMRKVLYYCFTPLLKLLSLPNKKDLINSIFKCDCAFFSLLFDNGSYTYSSYTITFKFQKSIFLLLFISFIPAQNSFLCVPVVTPFWFPPPIVLVIFFKYLIIYLTPRFWWFPVPSFRSDHLIIYLTGKLADEL